jgi:hypothetical protein
VIADASSSDAADGSGNNATPVRHLFQGGASVTVKLPVE